MSGFQTMRTTAAVVRPSLATTRLIPTGVVADWGLVLDPAYDRPIPSMKPISGPRIAFFALSSALRSGAQSLSFANHRSAYACALASVAGTAATISSPSPDVPRVLEVGLGRVRVRVSIAHQSEYSNS